MPKQGPVKRIWNAMRGREQPVPALPEKDKRVVLAMTKLRHVGIVENRALHFQASIVLDTAMRAYKEGAAVSYAAAIDKQEEVMRHINDGQLPLDERYAHELARRALKPGGLEAAQSWIEAVEAEVQGTPNSLYPNLIPAKRD